MHFFLFLLLCPIGRAQPPSAPSESVLNAKAVAGDFWGQAAKEAARELGASTAAEKPGLSGAWFLSSALEELSGRPSKKSARIELDEGSRLLSFSGRIFGYMVTTDSRDKQFYEHWAEKRFGDKKIVHLQFSPPTGVTDLPRFVHCMVWSDSKTSFAVITATVKRGVLVHRHAETGLEFRTHILHKKSDSAVPVYLVFWDSRKPAQ